MTATAAGLSTGVRVSAPVVLVKISCCSKRSSGSMLALIHGRSLVMACAGVGQAGAVIAPSKATPK